MPPICMTARDVETPPFDFNFKRTAKRRVLFCPAVFGHFLDPPGNHPRGAIFPSVDKISQSSVDLHCNPSGRLIDWLIDDKLTLTWLVYWIRTARSVFTGAGLQWPNIAGQYSTFSHFNLSASSGHGFSFSLKKIFFAANKSDSFFCCSVQRCAVIRSKPETSTAFWRRKSHVTASL